MTTTRALHHLPAWALVLALGCGALGAQAQSGEDAKKAARRAQLQMQQLQQKAQEAEAAKARIEGDKSALDKQLREQTQQVARLKGALPKALESLKASEAARAELAATVATLEKQLAEQKASHDAALAAAERSTKQRDEQQAQLQRQLDTQLAQVGECSAKNERLVRMSAELLDRYRNKSVSDVMKQRDPVFGLGDVQMFNLVQEYRDKADAERFSPSTNNR
jgi:chromosome segregation ATPase